MGGDDKKKSESPVPLKVEIYSVITKAFKEKWAHTSGLLQTIPGGEPGVWASGQPQHLTHHQSQPRLVHTDSHDGLNEAGPGTRSSSLASGYHHPYPSVEDTRR